MQSLHAEGRFPDSSLALASTVARANPDYVALPGTDSVFIHMDVVPTVTNELDRNEFAQVFVAAAALRDRVVKARSDRELARQMSVEAQQGWEFAAVSRAVALRQGHAAPYKAVRATVNDRNKEQGL